MGTLTAFALAVEVGDWARLTGATIGAYLGLVPSESQSGPATPAGPSPRPETATPAGSWWRPPGTIAAPPPSAPLERRRAGQRAEVRARAEAAGRRLHRRWTHLEGRRGLRSTLVAPPWPANWPAGAGALR